MAGSAKMHIGEIIGAFISIMFGLGLQSQVNSIGATIVADENSSEILKNIAPFLGVIWFLVCLGIAFALMYKFYKG